jgi:hypothetical protein
MTAAMLLVIIGATTRNAAAGDESRNLLFHVSFDDGVRAVTARGAGEPGVAGNIPKPLPAGRIGKAVALEAGARLSYPTKGNVNPGSGSVLVWIKPRWQARPAGDLAQGSRGIFDCGTADRDNSDVYLAYFPHIPGIAATFDAAGKAEMHGNPTLWADDEWHHVAMTWDCTSGIRLYCDGAEVMRKTIAWRPRPISPYFSVGSGYRFANPISGLVDELLIYDRPLSREEILAHVRWTGGTLPSVPYRKPYDGPLEQLTFDPNYLKARQHMPLAPRPEIVDLKHSILHYDRRWYCGHPRQGILAYFGGVEIVVGHNHAPCEYRTPNDVKHDLGGYHSRAVLLLQRSTDGGKTWPREDEVVVYDETMTTPKKQAFLYQKNARRERYDMFRPESIFFFGRTYLPEDRDSVGRCFALRSPDKGRTWEKVPTIVRHPDDDRSWVLKDCHPVVPMPDGRTLLAVMSLANPGGAGIYASEDQGLSWQFVSRAGWDRSGQGRFTYAGLLRMPDSELQCYALHIANGSSTVEGCKNAICLFRSRDGGRTWSDPVPIVGQGRACWKNPAKTGHVHYRSPWPMLLSDGRILVLFARRWMPMGIGGAVSADAGRTWSEEFIIRDDALSPDLGYPVACQLDDGRIFTAYYYTMPDGNGFGGTRYIAGTHFRIRAGTTDDRKLHGHPTTQ